MEARISFPKAPDFPLPVPVFEHQERSANPRGTSGDSRKHEKLGAD